MPSRVMTFEPRPDRPVALQHEEQSVIEPPDDERPLSAMPQPTKKENEQEIHASDPWALAGTAQRNKNIIAKPRRERNVPAPPELAHRRCHIRIIEVER